MATSTIWQPRYQVSVTTRSVPAKLACAAVRLDTVLHIDRRHPHDAAHILAVGIHAVQRRYCAPRGRHRRAAVVDVRPEAAAVAPVLSFRRSHVPPSGRLCLWVLSVHRRREDVEPDPARLDRHHVRLVHDGSRLRYGRRARPGPQRGVLPQGTLDTLISPPPPPPAVTAP